MNNTGKKPDKHEREAEGEGEEEREIVDKLKNEELHSTEGAKQNREKVRRGEGTYPTLGVVDKGEATGSSSKNHDKGNSAANSTMEVKRPRLCCSYRMLVSFGGFLIFFNVTMIRVGTVMAMVCMSEPRSRNITSDPQCPDINEEASSLIYEFKWSSTLQGIINSGSFYGFLIGPFIGGFLSFRFGGRLILLIGTFVAAFLTLFIPEMTRSNPYFFFGIRILTGFFGGWLFPSTFDILSHWTLPDERQILVGGALIGVPTFAVLNYPMNGMICKYLGWIWIFYMSSIWLAMCAAFAVIFMYDNPQDCPFAKNEVEYILPRTPGHSAGIKVPWRKIFLSRSVHAYIVTHFCMNYTLITVVLHLPIFMREVHHFQLSSNSFLSASPYIGALCCRILTTFTFDKIRNRLSLTKTCLRKCFVFIGVLVPSVSLIIISFLSCSYRYVTIAFFILFSTTFELSFTSGYLLSLMDMCPSYNNILSGFANTIANLAGLSSALVTGFCTPKGTQDEWNRVFYISVGFLVVAGFTYILFGTSELQPWGMINKGGANHLKRESLISQSSVT